MLTVLIFIVIGLLVCLIRALRSPCIVSGWTDQMKVFFSWVGIAAALGLIVSSTGGLCVPTKWVLKNRIELQPLVVDGLPKFLFRHEGGHFYFIKIHGLTKKVNTWVDEKKIEYRWGERAKEFYIKRFKNEKLHPFFFTGFENSRDIFILQNENDIF